MSCALLRKTVDAAYALEPSHEAWSAELRSILGPRIDGGFGVYCLELEEVGDRDLRLATFWPRETAADRVVAQWTDYMLRLTSDKAYETYERGTPCSTVRSVAESDLPSKAAQLFGVPFVDAKNLIAPDRAGRGLILFAPQRELGGYTRREEQLLSTALTFVSAGSRLRRCVGALSDSGAVEARFDERGHCVDASGIAREPSVLARLRELVRHKVVAQSEARGHGAVEFNQDLGAKWDAVIDGRWSIVDRVDNDGKQFVVVYRNPPGVLDPRALTPREREIAPYACRGLSLADIATHTGASASTVGVQVANIVRKLGLKSRLQLPGFYRATRAHCLPLTESTDLCALFADTAAESVSPWKNRLTPSEGHVAKLIAEGHSTNDVAKLRSVSPRTISNQVASIFKKLRIHSRAELVASSEETQG